MLPMNGLFATGLRLPEFFKSPSPSEEVGNRITIKKSFPPAIDDGMRKEKIGRDNDSPLGRIIGKSSPLIKKGNESYGTEYHTRQGTEDT